MDDLDELRSLRRIEQALDEMALLFARRAAEVRAAITSPSSTAKPRRRPARLDRPQPLGLTAKPGRSIGRVFRVRSVTLGLTGRGGPLRVSTIIAGSARRRLGRHSDSAGGYVSVRLHS